MSMNRVLLTVLSLSVYGAVLGAQNVYLVNETDSTLYLLQGAAPLGIEGTRFDPQARYRQVPAGGVLPVDPAAELAGFAYSRGLFQLPTFGISAAELVEISYESGSGRRYVVLSDERLTTDHIVSPSTFASLLSRPRVDNQYLEWVGREARVARGANRAPLGVYADFGEGREPTGVNDSLLWGRGGTDLQWVKTDRSEDDFFLAATVYSQFARSTSIFLYLYGPHSDIPVATLEFPAGRGPGFVLLYVPAHPQPIVAGNLVSNELFMEAQIWRETVQSVVALRGEMTVEISTASSAAGIWEEFVLARDDFGALFPE